MISGSLASASSCSAADGCAATAASRAQRHRNGDELVQVLDGETTMTILTDHGPTELTLTAGMLTVVPQVLWHRFRAAEAVTLMTVTPQPTDHSTAEDPRDED